MKTKLSRGQKIDGLVILGWTFVVLAYFLPKLLAQTILPIPPSGMGRRLNNRSHSGNSARACSGMG